MKNCTRRKKEKCGVAVDAACPWMDHGTFPVNAQISADSWFCVERFVHCSMICFCGGGGAAFFGFAGLLAPSLLVVLFGRGTGYRIIIIIDDLLVMTMMMVSVVVSWRHSIK